MNRLEKLVTEQLALVATFQRELEACRREVEAKEEQINGYEVSWVRLW